MTPTFKNENAKKPIFFDRLPIDGVMASGSPAGDPGLSFAHIRALAARLKNKMRRIIAKLRYIKVDSYVGKQRGQVVDNRISKSGAPIYTDFVRTSANLRGYRGRLFTMSRNPKGAKHPRMGM